MNGLDISSLTYFSFKNMHSVERIYGIENLDTSSLTDMNHMFANCRALKEMDISKWNVSKVKDMFCMFSNCYNLTTTYDLNNWDVRNVINMSYMFQSCPILEKMNISGWNMEHLKRINNIFDNCCGMLSIDITDIKFPKLKSLGAMFYRCNKLNEITGHESLDTSNIVNMYSMFSGCKSLERLDLSKWNMDNIETIDFFLSDCENLKTIGDTSNWKLEKVEDVQYMFANCKKLTQLNLSNTRLKNISTFSYMFERCKSLTDIGNISQWDTSKTTDMYSMFDGCVKLKHLDIENWDVRRVTDFCNMFKDCKNLSTDIRKWKISISDAIFTNMVDGTTAGLFKC